MLLSVSIVFKLFFGCSYILLYSRFALSAMSVHPSCGPVLTRAALQTRTAPVPVRKERPKQTANTGAAGSARPKPAYDGILPESLRSVWGKVERA